MTSEVTYNSKYMIPLEKVLDLKSPKVGFDCHLQHLVIVWSQGDLLNRKTIPGVVMS